MNRAAFLKDLPALAHISRLVDRYFETAHPEFFGPEAVHPVLPVKTSKVVHDNLWGTNTLSWRELVLIDSPIFQRLRDIHQVGLAYHVYPSARHTRFEHCVGVMTVASRTFDALLTRSRGEIETILNSIPVGGDTDLRILQLKQELRLAALLHDVGHSLFSHTSELVYEKLSPLKAASLELSRLTGKSKGAGEVISFCVALSDGVTGLLSSAQSRRLKSGTPKEYEGPVNLVRVALFLVGRSDHPFFQFIADIVSSGFDSDKLDYLLRDAANAGLPLRYDLERYLYSIRIEKETLADGEDRLEALYNAAGHSVSRSPKNSSNSFPFYDTYRLRLPKEGMNAIEQIVICKLMLFSYIYHHPKVRAAEGLLKRALERKVDMWQRHGTSDDDIVTFFLGMSDAAIGGDLAAEPTDAVLQQYLYRIRNRVLPREVYGINGSVPSHAERALVTNFLTALQDKANRERIVDEVQRNIGEELLNMRAGMAANADEALVKAGVWLDVPRPPTFEDVNELVVRRTNEETGIPLTLVFPIGQWTQAYTHFRYNVRVFAFSEFHGDVVIAARRALSKVTKIHSESFYEAIRRDRSH